MPNNICHQYGAISSIRRKLLFLSLVIAYLTAPLLRKAYTALLISSSNHHWSQEISDRGVYPGLVNAHLHVRDVMDIASLANSPLGRGHAMGDVPFNVTREETVSCWRRLAERLGRRPHLVVVGDSRARGLYQHLRRRWGLTAHTVAGTECLRHFAYKNRTDWCHYRAGSPHLDLSFYWSRLADGGLLSVLDTVRSQCGGRSTSCPLLLIVSLGTHVLTVPESSHSLCLLAAVSGIEQTALSLERLTTLGVRVFWKLSEPENYERLTALSASVNYAHLIYNAMIVDRLEQLAPSVRRWSSVLPPAENYLAHCRLDPVWQALPDKPPLRNCYDHLHYGDAVQDQYRNQLQRHLCPI